MNGMEISGAQLGGMAAALVILIGLYLKVGRVEDRMASRVMTEVKALIKSGGNTGVDISPNPLSVKMEDEFVKRGSFHKHAELNREAHEAIDKRVDEEVRAVVKELKETNRALNELSREVGELKAVGEVRSQQLVEMDRKLDGIRRHQS